MKFLHCSDVHLGRRPLGGRGNFSDKRFNDYFLAFDNAVNKAIDNKVDAMIIAGDFFDKKELHPEVLQRAETALQVISDNNISTILIEGNHDNIYRDKYHESWIIYLENKGLIQRPYCRFENETFEFYTVKLNDINFFGLGYPGASAPEMLAALAGHLEENYDAGNNVVLIHTGLGSGDFIHGTIKKEDIELLRDKAIYVAGGHLHEFNAYPEENPFFFLPGSLEYFDMGDGSKKKKMGMILFDTDTKKYDFIESNPRNILRHSFTSDAENPHEFDEKFKREINSLQIAGDEDIVEVEIKLLNDIYVDIKFCEDELERLGALKSIIKITRDGISAGNLSSTNLSTVSEYEKYYIKKWDDLGIYADVITDSLQKLKQHQNDNDENSFFEAFDNMIGHIIREENNEN